MSVLELLTLEMLFQSSVMGVYSDIATKAEIYPLTCDIDLMKKLASATEIV